ncbi:hypothetical protein V8D89_013957 [Ganoderma adspersum]
MDTSEKSILKDPSKHRISVSSVKDDRTEIPARTHQKSCVALAVFLSSSLLLSVVCLGWLWDRRVVSEAPRSTQLGALPPNESSELCPQVPALLPVRHTDLAKTLDSLYAQDDYKLKAYGVLGGAVQIPTEAYDGMGPVGIDPRWDVFTKFHDYLERTFPAVFSTLEVTKVNTYGIVLRWEGLDPFLYPVLITAHQDVVPVEPATAKDWVHPPYSGYYDGTWIWGRGSGDDKADLIASLHAISALLEQEFTPTRTFVWAFGFDEEASGLEGAGQIAKYLEREFGRDGFAILLDEGDYYGTPYGDDVIFAMPSLSEKGYLDVRIEVTTKGGHSSLPPRHTTIGVLSAMVVALEAQPHQAVLERGGSPYNSTMCAATYGPTFPEDLRQLAFKAAGSDDSGLFVDESDRERDELQARKDARAARQAVRNARREALRAKYKALRKSRNRAGMSMREAIQEARDDWNEDTQDLKDDWQEMKDEGKDLIEELKDVPVELRLAFSNFLSTFSWEEWGKAGRHDVKGTVDALEELKDALLQTFPLYDALLRTTQAVDLISGGVKVNALPELAAAVVNHRIAQHSGLVDVQAHVKSVILPLATQFNLSMEAFGYWEPAGDGSGGHVRLSDSWYSGLLPSPITPTGPDDPYQILAGTIKATLQSAEGYHARGVVVAPQVALGNTDTQFYWDLTKNIIRYSHLSGGDLYNGLHTVNEAVRGEAWIQLIRFYTRFILNCDEHLKVGNF